MASLFLVWIHSTPGVDGAQPLRLAATGFLFSALPHCVLFSTRGPQDLHCLHSNSLLLLPSPYWIEEYRTLPGWLDVQRPPREERDDPSYPSFGLRCLPLLSRLCCATWSNYVSLNEMICNGCFSIDECGRYM